MSTLICILTIVTMRFHYRDSNLKVSKTAATVLKILQLNFFRIPCNMCKRKSQIRVASKLDDRFVQNVKDGKVKPLTVEQVVEDTWKIVASQYDQVLMYYFFVIVFLQWIMLLIVISIWNCPKNQSLVCLFLDCDNENEHVDMDDYGCYHAVSV